MPQIKETMKNYRNTDLSNKKPVYSNFKQSQWSVNSKKQP